jgi:hypothetical protein
MANKPVKTVSGRIQVTAARRRHILDGDATGGGHGPGRGVSGKSEFPATLTDDEIIDGMEAIANDSGSYPGRAIPVSGGKQVIRGKIKGIETAVVVDPAKRQVVTGYPLNVPRNP